MSCFFLYLDRLIDDTCSDNPAHARELLQRLVKVLADDAADNKVIRGVHGVAERENALFKETFAALRMVSLSPGRIGAITEAALVLLHLERNRPLPGSYNA